MQVPTTPIDDTLLTFKEAMDYLSISRTTLTRFMENGKVVGHKVGSTWRFYKADLKECIRPERPPSSTHSEAPASSVTYPEPSTGCFCPSCTSKRHAMARPDVQEHIVKTLESVKERQ